MLLRNVLLLATLAAFSAGCGDKSSGKKKSDDESESAEDTPKKEKKKKKKKDDAADSAQAKATDAPSAPSTGSAPTAPPPSGNPLATFFTGDPDPAIKFLKQKQIPNKPVWIQVVPYWDANTDHTPDEEPWTDLVLEGKERHATIRMWIRAPGEAGWDTELSNNCAWAAASGCKFDPPIDGTLGQGIKVKIAQGTAEKNKKPAKVWWMRGEIKPGEELAVYVSLRADVWPKLEGETMAMLKSVKVAGP
jgi:hypothetical protein